MESERIRDCFSQRKLCVTHTPVTPPHTMVSDMEVSSFQRALCYVLRIIGGKGGREREREREG